MKKQLLTLIIAIILLCPFTVKAEETLNGLVVEDGYTYYYVNGVRQSGFQEIEGKTYFFSRVDQKMRTGIFQIDGVYYAFNSDGTMYVGWYENGGDKYYFTDKGRASGFTNIDGKTYFFSRVGDNPMRTGIFQIDGVYYAFNNDGSMYIGWYENRGNKYYFTDKGRASGFTNIDGSTYFFSRWEDNPMRTGIFQIDGVYYAFNNDGSMYIGWYENRGNKYYFTDKGRASGFTNIDGSTYFFSRWEDNPMRTGFFQIDGVYYYFDNTGKMQTGWHNIDGDDKYFLDNGQMAIGLVKIGNDYYYFDSNGDIKNGWQIINGKTYYFDKKTNIAKIGLNKIDGYDYYFSNEGVMQTGLQNIDGATYFFSRVDGRMRTGFFQIDGIYYYFNDDGVMQTGWQEMLGGVRYFDATGKMQLGIVEIDGLKYYFNDLGFQAWGFQEVNGNTYFFSRVENHAMRTGFFQIDGIYYYFNEEGIMQTGFQTVDGIRRFFSRVDGHMRTSWTLIDGHMYYFNPVTGEMAVGNKTIDKVNYVFYDDGKLRDGFVTDTDGNRRYYFPDGSYANDWITIAGVKYFFNSLGVMIGENVKKVIDVSYHQGIIDWDKVKAEGDIDGVILRIAAGCEEEDTMLERNIKELQRLGIPYGIYIYSYAENYEEGRLYAEFTVNVIKKYNMNPTLGIYFDLEENGITIDLTTADYEQIVRGFMDVMNNNGYGDISKIYTYKEMADKKLNTEYLRNLITWVAQYNHYCYYTGNYVGWQYSSEETIPGITGNVDMNVWFS